VLTDNSSRGTIAFYFGLSAQTQDPILAHSYPTRHSIAACATQYSTATAPAPADSASATPTRSPGRAPRDPHTASPPGTAFNVQTQASAQNAQIVSGTAVLTADDSAFTGNTSIIYQLGVQVGPGGSQASVTVNVLDGTDSSSGPFTINSGAPFVVGSFGLMATLTWTGTLISGPSTGQWLILLTSNMVALGGANVSGMIYELLTSSVHGIALDAAVINNAAFNSARSRCYKWG